MLSSHNCELLFDQDLLDPQIVKVAGGGFLIDGIRQQASVFEPVASGGRGQAWFLQLGELSAVLRAYQRGGLIAKFNRQTYFGRAAEKSRSFLEWRLLQWMFDQGLPVPKPLAASICHWPFRLSPFYHAHILVQRIPNTKTLDQILCEQPLQEQQWHNIGLCIARFHNAGVLHADLNSNNILLDLSETVYLIDFDKSKRITNVAEDGLLADQTQWRTANLQRLQRSLIKQQGLHQSYYFTQDNWQALLTGYAETDNRA